MKYIVGRDKYGGPFLPYRTDLSSCCGVTPTWSGDDYVEALAVARAENARVREEKRANWEAEKAGRKRERLEQQKAEIQAKLDFLAGRTEP